MNLVFRDGYYKLQFSLKFMKIVDNMLSSLAHCFISGRANNGIVRIIVSMVGKNLPYL